jgi:hypothetical protein
VVDKEENILQGEYLSVLESLWAPAVAITLPRWEKAAVGKEEKNLLDCCFEAALIKKELNMMVLLIDAECYCWCWQNYYED